MKNNKSSLKRTVDAFVCTVVIACSVTLVASGIAISKVNTDYMSTGVRASKIIAERDNREIFISINGQRLNNSDKRTLDLDKILVLMPAPLNSFYILITEISALLHS